ncbi:MAG TPA: FMN-binding protein [Ilumatobacteraceae bacterium]|nr:FMN-binding protein [Ilumatobacteraceae bacterium]
MNARLDALASRRSLPPPPAPVGSSAPSPAGRRTRRRHAARGARAAALGLSLASTGALATLFAVTGGRASAGNQVAAATVVASPRSATPTEPASAASTSTAAPTQPPATTTPAATVATPAIVDGAVFNNKWGDVQVEATFAPDGTLLDVTTLQTPYRDGKSVRINDRAIPQLNSEALTSQSANVDTVSGATYTSNDYRRSLQSAIDTARTAGLTAIA